MRQSFGHAALGGATRAFSTPPRVDFEAHGMELSRNGQYVEAVHVFSRGLRAAADRSKSGESLWHHRFNAYCKLGHFHLAYADMLAMNSLGVHEPPGALFLAEMMMAKVEHNPHKTYSPVFLPKWIPEQRNVLEVIHQHSGFAAQHGLELRLTPDRGLGLYALRRFSANEAVLKEAPYIFTHRPRRVTARFAGFFRGRQNPAPTDVAPRTAASGADQRHGNHSIAGSAAITARLQTSCVYFMSISFHDSYYSSRGSWP